MSEPAGGPIETRLAAAMEKVVGVWDVPDPTNGESDPHLHWTTTNLREAIPGVQTPLSWTIWSRVTDDAAREAGYRVGALSRAERVSGMRERERYVRAFYGRAAIQVEFQTTLGDRLPGTTGAQAAESVFGRVPKDLVLAPTTRRYPVIAWRLPLAFAGVPRTLRRFGAEQDAWWKSSVAGVDTLDYPELIDLLVEAARRFERAMSVQTVGIVSTMQALYEAVRQLVETAGAGDLSTLTGASGGAEMAVINDIWRASRRQIEPAEVVRNHGFHGPDEGELSSRVWREDDSPLRRMIEQYATRDDALDPERKEARRRAERGAAERELLDAVPATQRPAARLLLRFARERLPLRGVGKRAFLQVFDVARAASRRAGERLAHDGVLDDPFDVFFLTAPELAGPLPSDARDLVARRREARERYSTLEIPLDWTGMPAASPAESAAGRTGEAGGTLSGLGVSGGVIEGPARVLTSPDFAEVEPDEVLVAHTTDPSWSSIMFLSSALVMDIGGALSHAAVVARELEIPCVVNTQSGTTRIRTGDRVRVDGDAGTVEVLSPAA